MSVDAADVLEPLTNAIRGFVAEPPDFHRDLSSWLVLGHVSKTVGDVRSELAHRVGEAMPKGSVMVPGVGMVRRSRDRYLYTPDGDGAQDALVRDVLDSRRVDKTTGEVVDETPVEKIRAVWNLPPRSARTTELKARGLRLDDYGEVVDRGYRISVSYEGGSDAVVSV